MYRIVNFSFFLSTVIIQSCLYCKLKPQTFASFVFQYDANFYSRKKYHEGRGEKMDFQVHIAGLAIIGKNVRDR